MCVIMVLVVFIIELVGLKVAIELYFLKGGRKEGSGRVGGREEGRERGVLASSGIKCFPVLAKNVRGYLFSNWNPHF